MGHSHLRRLHPAGNLYCHIRQCRLFQVQQWFGHASGERLLLFPRFASVLSRHEEVTVR